MACFLLSEKVLSWTRHFSRLLMHQICWDVLSFWWTPVSLWWLSLYSPGKLRVSGVFLAFCVTETLTNENTNNKFSMAYWNYSRTVNQFLTHIKKNQTILPCECKTLSFSEQKFWDVKYKSTMFGLLRDPRLRLNSVSRDSPWRHQRDLAKITSTTTDFIRPLTSTQFYLDELEWIRYYSQEYREKEESLRMEWSDKEFHNGIYSTSLFFNCIFLWSGLKYFISTEVYGLNANYWERHLSLPF